MFEEVFEKVMDELNISNWWELFDSDSFSIVEERISHILGYDCWDCREFVNWYNDMCMDL